MDSGLNFKFDVKWNAWPGDVNCEIDLGKIVENDFGSEIKLQEWQRYLHPAKPP